MEFNRDRYLEIPEGEVLILAGDICLYDEIDKTLPFFEQCVAKYDKVYYVLGNHEYYHSKWDEVLPGMRAKLPKGITLLQDQSEYYNGVHFVGATMWTNFNGSGVEIESAKSYMNDYHVIEGFSPEKAMKENDNTIDWFKSCVPMLKRAPVVMITHHAPSEQSVKGRYINSTSAYANRLESFIKDHPNIGYWCHGHIHHNNNYKVGDCTILSNPRGYENIEENKDFSVFNEFHITDEEMQSFRT